VPTAGAWIEAAHPNPFRPPVAIAYTVGRPGSVRLAIYDAAGRRVAMLADGRVEAGRHLVSWDGRNQRGERAASGVYFARLEAGALTHQMKLILSR
jgi:flagellar hook assembly protein FlgD